MPFLAYVLRQKQVIDLAHTEGVKITQECFYFKMPDLMKPRLTLSPGYSRDSSCLSFPYARITAMHCYACLTSLLFLAHLTEI